jgi:hypothetical protein
MDYFVSLHGVCHDLHKIQPKEYVTKVPRGLRVYTFAPTNSCVYSNDQSEAMMMDILRKPHWKSSPEVRPGGMFAHTQYYPPHSRMCNLLLDGDTPQHFGVYELTTPPKKLDLVFDATKPDTTYDVERMLELLRSKPRTRNVYFCICSPHTISPYSESVLKWKGRSNPRRKSTLKYESFAMSPELLRKATVIQENRLRLETLGRERFLNQIPHYERRFTRSMSFPLRLRNGSTDHVPSQIGIGLGDAPPKNGQKGLYFAVDKQDEETNRVYTLLRQIKLKNIHVLITTDTLCTPVHT